MKTHQVYQRIKNIATVCTWFGVSICCAADDGIIDSYITVDHGKKYYNFERTESDKIKYKEKGEFNSNVIISPTIRVDFRDPDEPISGLGLIGLSFGHHSVGYISVDSYEWHIGIGISGRVSRWTRINLMATAGYGITGVHTSKSWKNIQSNNTEWGVSGHGEITAEITYEIEHALIVLQAGYRFTELELEDYEENRIANYLVHGPVLAIGVGISF